MAESMPYMNSTGLIPKILDKIKEARTPDRFSQDFLGTVLGFSGGSAKPFIPLAKRLGLINSDGTPSALYNRFRGSEEESKAAMAAAMKIAFAPLYKRNEFAERMEKKKLEGLVKEITGLEDTSSTFRGIIGTFEALKKYADFNITPDNSNAADDEQSGDGGGSGSDSGGSGDDDFQSDLGKLRFGYTININLPNTNDIAVFNAIFKSLKEHLL
ncbi:DUF5343 domain-containing protein [Lacisediminihabitans sp. H27-G8]|uniref:DUF5343 domain-containing protein n=1 Tax=Lacisediminihabitans sp. H27-G8 TaxID=3111909 RepID=UPI0038FD35B8